MYKVGIFRRSSIKSVEKTEGESIEQKIERASHNKEAISDGAPLIYSERKDGVLPGGDIRTDRWEIAADAMDLVSKNLAAQRDGSLEVARKDREAKKKQAEGSSGDGKAESAQGGDGEK